MRWYIGAIHLETVLSPPPPSFYFPCLIASRSQSIGSSSATAFEGPGFGKLFTVVYCPQFHELACVSVHVPSPCRSNMRRV